MAEFAFDLVTPDYAYQRLRRNISLTKRQQIAGDVREGLTMAYDTMRDVILFVYVIFALCYFFRVFGIRHKL